MNMNKKILFIIITFLSFNIFIGDVYAKKCSEIRFDEYDSEQEFVDACLKNDDTMYRCKVWTPPLNSEPSCYENGCGENAILDGDVCVCRYGYKEENGKCVVDDSAGNQQNVDCSTLTSQKNCSANLKCVWDNVNKVCKLDELLAEPCSEKNIKVALRFIGYLLTVVKTAVPIIIIVMGVLDLFKSVVDKDDKSLSKQAKILGMRIIGGVFIFFLPTIVYALFDLSSDLNIVSSSKYEACVTCVLKPNDCNV